jgi:NAD(P)-dependent dehydrogenase (short-subunit alcohol dehydrogenase family)
MSKIWLITGVSSGFGRSLAEAVVKAGDVVFGTLRNPAQCAEFNALHPGKAFGVMMDVNNPQQVAEGVKSIFKEHGRIDVLVNNAGYGLFGAVEEASDEETRAQMETNFFGALALTRAVLPGMRKAKRGHIVQISSVASFASTPGLGIYNASKHALEGASEALAQEVAPLGIKVLIVEPGPYRTKWAKSGAKDAAKKIEDYAATAHATMQMIHGYEGKQPGCPDKGAKLIVDAVNSPNPPLRLPLGKIAIDRMREKMRVLEREISAWEKQSIATAFDDVKAA